MEVIELRNPNALMVPEVWQLLERALSTRNIMAPGGLSSVAGDLVNYAKNPSRFLLLGAEDGQFKCVVMLELPSSMLFPTPVLTLAYNEGSKELLKTTQKRVLDIVTNHGYTKLWAANTSGRSDKAWEKAFKLAGVVPERLGSLYNFKVE